MLRIRLSHPFRSVRLAGAIVAVLGLGACAINEAELPFDQSPYLWPAVAPAAQAKGARAETAGTVFTVRTSRWLNSPEENQAVIARQCGPKFKTARVFRREHGGSILHPVELTVYCGDVPPRTAVYPEPGTGPSDNLAAMTFATPAADRGELLRLR